MPEATTKKTPVALRESERKWGKPAIAAGFTVIPNILLTKQHALGLDCIDIVLILQILKHWWHHENAPFPSQVQLAKTMGTDRSTVTRHLQRLRTLGLIAWSSRSNNSGGRSSNAYDFSGLIAKVAEYAEGELRARADEADKRKERARRKRPHHLRLVPEGELDDA